MTDNPMNGQQPHESIADAITRQCTATSKRSGLRCRKHAIIGRSTCRNHGGATPRGVASPHTRHGRYSKSLPERLAERFAAGQADPELLSLRDDLALLDARMEDVLRRVDSGESGQAWRQLRSIYDALLRAQRDGDQSGATAQFDILGGLIQHGLSDAAAWADLRMLMEQRRRLVESERRRMVEMQQMITVDKAVMFTDALTAAVKRHVHDRDTLAAISQEFVRLAEHHVGGHQR